MKDEIKEILECMKQYGSTTELALLDYITNLQEENKKFKNWINVLNKDNHNYKSKIDKAIEFIKSYKNDYAPYELSDYNIRELLKILKGENKC